MQQILALFLSTALLLTGCAQAGGGAGDAAPGGRALAQPAYPEFPAHPEEPQDGGWEAYLQQLEDYYDALAKLRGEPLDDSLLECLNGFAGASAALALEDCQGENAIYSPVSLWAALALLAQCAEGGSRAQVLDALGVRDVEALQPYMSQVWRRLYTDNGKSSLILANSVWLNSRREAHYVQGTLDILREQYFAGAYAVPMGQTEADRAVTDWISRQTNGLIGSGDPVVRTDPNTLALLVSSLYYRAGWTDGFQPHLTREDGFTDGKGQAAQADFMHRSGTGNWLRGERFQAAALPTELGEMVFVLPNEGVKPEALLQDPAFLQNLDLYRGEGAHFGPIEWSVPKFDAASTLNLMEALERLGITDLLDGSRADLSALTDLDAVLSDAKQLARVKVDEEGVEAAAATVLMMAETALRAEDPEVCVMDLDRPFLFVLRYEGVPLFVGVINEAS